MTDRQGSPDDLPRRRPATVAQADELLRRKVAMAYRTARKARRSHHHALAAATAAYHEEHHKARAVPFEAALRIARKTESA